MIGIYKITCLKTKKVYIGQSVNIARRWRDHRCTTKNIKSRLSNSIRKHGVENHLFEVVTECCIDDLNNLERYYQEIYSTIGNNGLNCKITKSDDKSGYVSEETKANMRSANRVLNFTPEYRAKISKANSGKKFTEEHKQKLSNAHKGRSNHWNIGRELSQEHKDNIGKAHKGKKLSPEQVEFIRQMKTGSIGWNKGQKTKESTLLKMSLGRKGKYLGEDNWASRPVLDMQTGIYYVSAKEAAELLKINRTTLVGWLNGSYKNKTSLIYA